MRRAEAIAQGLLHKLMLACVGVCEEAARQRRLILAASRRMLTQSCGHRRLAPINLSLNIQQFSDRLIRAKTSEIKSFYQTFDESACIILRYVLKDT